MQHQIEATTSIVSHWLHRLDLAAGQYLDVSSTPSMHEDKALLTRIWGGDRDALEDFINRHARAVYSCIRHRVRERETADDLFQETWIRVIERCHTYHGDNAVLPWLYRIAINVVNDEFRRQMARRRGGDVSHVTLDEARGHATATNTAADEVLMQNQERGILYSAVMALPDPYGEVVRLRYFEELSVTEAAEVLNCAEGTVKSRLSRGLTMLQKSLKELS